MHASVCVSGHGIAGREISVIVRKEGYLKENDASFVRF